VEFDHFPEGLPELAAILRADLSVSEQIKLFSKRLGRILHRVWQGIAHQRIGATDFETLVSAARIMASVVSFCATVPLEYPGLPSVHPHEFAVAFAVADAIVASSLYPHARQCGPGGFSCVRRSTISRMRA
jgi:hypothetical protein